MLYTLSYSSFWPVGIQVLDGVGAGIFDALTPLAIADIMGGTGRGLAAGVIVDHFGYSAAFPAAGAAAAVALAVFALWMPETAGPKTVAAPS